MTDMIGKTFGRYQIQELLGSGGMAAVYKAYDPHLDRLVALKIIFPGFQHSQKFLKRFELEAKSLAQLSHANIVRVLDYGDQDGVPFLVMEYITGGTLKDLMTGTLHWQYAARLLASIAHALDYVHQQKIIHRDVKPANILITDNGQPTLSDFGIVELIEKEGVEMLTGVSVGMGTPEYMSPEQASGKAVDYQADIYALGVVFYEMVTGHKPYEAGTAMEVVIKQATETLEDPRHYIPDLPDFVINVIHKSLAKKTKDRYATIGLFAQELETLARRKEMTDKVKKKKPAWIYAIISVLIIIALAAIAVPLFSWFLPKLNHPISMNDHSTNVGNTQAAVQSTPRTPVHTLTPTPTSSQSSPIPTVTQTRLPPSLDTSTLSQQMGNQKTPEQIMTTADADLLSLAETPFKIPDDPLSAIITQKERKIVELARIGSGKIEQINWSPDGRYIASATSIGIFIYDTQVTPGTAGSYRYLDTGEWMRSVIFSPDGKFIIAGSKSGSLKVWDVETFKEVTSLVGHTASVNSLAFSHDAQRLASGSDDRTIHVWQTLGWQEEFSLNKGSIEINSVSFSPDDTYLLAGASDGRAQIWMLDKKEVLFSIYHRGSVSGAFFLPAGNRLVSGGLDGYVKVWDMKTQNIINDIPVSNKQGVLSMAISANSQYVAAGLANNDIQIWNLKDMSQYWLIKGHWLPQYGWTRDVVGKDFDLTNTVAFSPDGNRLAVGLWDSTITVYELATKALQTSTNGATMYTYGLAFSPDSSQLAIEAWNENGVVNLWKLPTNISERTFNLYIDQGYPFSPDGKYLVAEGKIWEINSGNMVRALNAYNLFRFGPSFNPGDRLLPFKDLLWNIKENKSEEFCSTCKDPLNVNFSPDGKLIATGSYHRLAIWDVASGQQIDYTTTFFQGCLTASSADGSHILSSSGPLLLFRDWDKVSADYCTAIIQKDVYNQYLSWDTKLLVEKLGLFIQVWNLEGNLNFWKEEDPHKAERELMMFSPDNRLLVIASQDGSITIRNALDGEVFASWIGHRDSITGLALSPDSKLFATSSWDGTVRIWGLR